MTSEQTGMLQRSGKRLFFEHQEMDFYFSWVLGRHFYEGCDEQTCYDVAARIVDGDAASWQAAWSRVADETFAQANADLEAGRREAARIGFLHACTYYRAPLFIMGPSDPRFYDLAQRMRLSFRRAAALFEPPIEQVELTYKGKQLPGYFWKVDDSGARRPTLIVIGGLETWAEDCYFFVGSAGPAAGFNVLTVDVPGQGFNPDQDLYLEARMDLPMQAVVDYALTRPEVDPRQLALYGFSWGGHIVMKAAANDSRLQALIANPPMPDVFRAAWAQQDGHARNDPLNKVVFSQIAWRFGLKISFNPRDIGARFGKAYGYLRYGKADVGDIRCPTLLIAGEAEHPITLELSQKTYEALPHPQKKLRIFTAEEGGEAHCQVDNLPLPNGLMFEWLDEVFGELKRA